MTTHAEKAKSIFLDAAEIPEEERRAFVERKCSGDEELRREVESLLYHGQLGGFLEEDLELAVTLDQPVSERPGMTIGRYKLLQEIGEGGMGVVYMAEQREPVVRKVALKIIRPGMDTRQVTARFEAERQALALMDHPNIAKVLDGGSAESGRPYFVMELVHGIPIIDYCDQNNLTTQERLELFVSVCQAVQHAHQKGIIHRDIKPSNVMVTLHDGVPVPKIIDFGVAKAISHRLTEKTAFTHYGQMIGTPLYMSPEQAEMSGLDVDTRTDVYSLGVLLYELLTGTTPFDEDRLRKAAFEELCSIIREEEPQRPSTKISTLGKAATTISTHRKTDPAKLSHLLRGEVDWIVMKALEKDRTRRYETANGFARDIQRYLSDEAVEACPPSRAYRFRKFVRRNKTVLATMTIVAFAVIAGSGVAAWQAVRATHQRDEAQHQRKIAQDNLQLAMRTLEEMYLDVVGDRVLFQLEDDDEEVGLTKTERELLSNALQFYEAFARQNTGNLVATANLGIAHLRIGDIQRRLLDLDAAEAAYREAIRLFEQQQFPAEVQYRTDIAVAYVRLASVLSTRERYAEVFNTLSPVEPLFHELVMAGTDDAHATFARGSELLGKALARMNRLAEAEEKYRQSLDHWDIHFAADPEAVPVWDVIRVREWLVKQLLETNRIVQAKHLLDQWDQGILLGDTHMKTVSKARKAILLANLGWYEQAFWTQRQATEADPNQWAGYLRQSITFQWLDPEILLPYLDKALERDPSDASSLLARASVYRALKMFDKALADVNKAIQLAPANALCYIERGMLYKEQEEFDLALDEWEQAIELDPYNQLGYYQRALTYAGRKDYVQAKAEIDRLVQLSSKRPAWQNDIAWFLVTCQDSQLRCPEWAVELAKEAVEQKPEEHNYWNTLGVAQYRAGKWRDAIRSLSRAIGLCGREGAASASAIDALPLALAYWRLGEREKARACHSLAIEGFNEDPNRPNYVELLEFRSEFERLIANDEQEPRRTAPASPSTGVSS